MRQTSSDPSSTDGSLRSIDRRIAMIAAIVNAVVAFKLGISVGIMSLPTHQTSLVPPIGGRKGHDNVISSSFTTTSTTTAATAIAPPMGEHLRLDFSNIDGTFLRDEKRIADAVAVISDELSLERGEQRLLSSRCHGTSSTTITCAWLYSSGSITINTFPDEGLLSVDLFRMMMSDNDMLTSPHHRNVFEKYLGVTRRVDDDDGSAACKTTTTETGTCKVEGMIPKMQWSHWIRGYPTSDSSSLTSSLRRLDPEKSLFRDVYCHLNLYRKEEVTSVTSDYHSIDIWDWLDEGQLPNFEDGKKWDMGRKDPRWKMTQYAGSNRDLYVDGVVKFVSNNEKECNEALVHPSLFTHPNPQNIAIVNLAAKGGGTLREVLKHDTVTSVTVIEIDEVLVNITREYLSSYINCGAIHNSADSCYDDPRTTLIIDDPRHWFSSLPPTGTTFDVIYVNGDDSGSIIDEKYLADLYSALSPDGIIVFNVATKPNVHQAPPDVSFRPSSSSSASARLWNILSLLSHHPSTSAVLFYEEPSCILESTQSFVLGCRSASCRDRWYADPVAVDDDIVHRLRSSLSYYDGGTQRLYQFPPRAWEKVYCRIEPMPKECAFADGLDVTKKIVDVENGGLILKPTGIFAAVKIKKGDYIMATDVTSSLIMSGGYKKNLERLASLTNNDDNNESVADQLLEFINEHGHTSVTEGSDAAIVEVGRGMFLRRVTDETEANLEGFGTDGGRMARPVFSPVWDRRRFLFDLILVAKRDIDMGEELLLYKGAWEV